MRITISLRALSAISRWPLCLLLLASVSLKASCAPQEGQKQTVMVPMSDGRKLATDIYMPARQKGSFPVVMERTPYGREKMAEGWAWAACAKGVVAVVQDMRGRFGSEGENLPFIGCGWADHQDGADTVAWLLKQEWCNGKIGTKGGSAAGITQDLLAATAPKGLVAQYIAVEAVNLFSHAAYVGGAFRKEQCEGWITSNRFDPKCLQLFLQHTHYDEYWTKFDAGAKFELMNVPAVHVGGWFDTFSQGTIDSFVGRQHKGAPGSKGNQKLIMGPWCHRVGYPGGKQCDLVFLRSQFPKQYNDSRWFQYHLLGVDNGIMKEPAVAYYVMGDTRDPKAPGNQWRYADDWPIPAVETPYYFRKDGGLATAPSAAKDQCREYTFDPANPCPTRGGKNLTIERGPVNQNPIEGRPDVLLFTTDPLEAPVEATGRVTAKVFIASSAADTDLSVRLCDVYPDGKSYEMAEGILRLRYREGTDREVPLATGKIYEVKVDCWSTSVIFNKGHRIRVIVTSSNCPRFDVNPGTGKMWKDGGEFVKQVNRIYCDAEHPSAILLPVPGPEKGKQ